MVGSVAFRFSNGHAAYDSVHSRENVFNIECALFMFMYLASYAPGGLPFNFQIPTLNVTVDLLNENELSLTTSQKFFTSL